MHVRQQTRRTRGGFTIVELVIAAAALSLLLGAMGVVQMRSRDASRVSVAQEEIESECRRNLDRVAEELEGVGHSLLFPDPSTSFGTSSLTYQHPSNVSNAGVVTWDSPRHLQLQLAAGEIDNGLDDNGDGLVDERALVLTRDFGTVNARSVTICSGIPELAGGETVNAIDDNGNGLVDEAGFNINRIGDLLTVRLTLEKPMGKGQIASSTLQTSIALHN